MTEYDSYIIQKLKNIQSSEDFLKQNPQETREAKLASMYGSVIMKQVQEALYEKDDEELTDEEYDNIYYDQEDDTSDESYDGDYNPYGHNIYDEKVPDDFDLWDNRVKSAWRKAHKIGEE